MKKYLLATALINILLFCNAQTFTWDSIVAPNSGFKFCKDKFFGIYNYQAGSIQKLHSSGGVLWQTNVHPNMQIKSIETSPDGSFYAAGNFTGACHMGNDTLLSKGGTDIWLAHYSAGGGLLWLRGGGSALQDNCGEICMFGTDVAMTGILQDTADFFGQQVAKSVGSDLFVATIGQGGILQGVEVAQPLPSPNNQQSFSAGWEIAADPSGNIYVLGSASGRSSLDTMTIANSFYGHHYYLLKLNSSFVPQWKHELSSCIYYCQIFSDLNVTASGASYYVASMSYNQSGAGVEYSTIYRLGSSGTGTLAYGIPANKRGWYSDIDLDAQDNLYFTGYYRPPSYPPTTSHVHLVNGRLDSNLQPVWLRLDSAMQFRKGMAIVATDVNECYIGGVFTGTLHLATTLYSGFSGNPVESFHAHMDATNLVGLKEYTEQKPAIYPNPCQQYLNISTNLPGEILISDLSGQLMMRTSVQEGRTVSDLSSLPAGAYILRFRSREGVFTLKLIRI